MKYAATDLVGNLESSQSQTIRIDTTKPSAPSLSFDNLSHASVTGSTVYYRPSASDGSLDVTASSTDGESGVSGYSFPAAAAGWTRTVAVATATYSHTGSPTEPGAGQAVTAQNAAGLSSNPTSYTVAADSTAPATTIACDASPCTAGWITTSPVSVTLGATDGGSGVDHIVYSTDGSDPTSGGNTYAGAFTVAATTTVKYAAYDNVGNVETVKSRTIQIDTTPPSAPSLTLSGFTNASATGSTVYYNPGNAGGFTVTASSSDPQSGIASYGFPSLGSGWSGSAGAYTFSASASEPGAGQSVSATNGAGLSSNSSFTVQADGQAPSTALECDGAPCSNGWATTSPVSITLNATDGGSGVDHVVYTTDGSDPTAGGTTYSGAFTVGGSTTVKYAAYDNVGNVEAVNSTTIRIDTTPPSAPSLSFSGFTNASSTGSTVWFRAGATGGFTVDPSSTDPQSGVASYSYPSLGSGWSGSAGAYTFGAAAVEPGSGQDVHATNNAGLDSAATSFTVTADGNAPSASISCDGGACTAGWHTTSPIQVTLAASDGGLGSTTSPSRPTAPTRPPAAHLLRRIHGRDDDDRALRGDGQGRKRHRRLADDRDRHERARDERRRRQRDRLRVPELRHGLLPARRIRWLRHHGRGQRRAVRRAEGHLPVGRRLRLRRRRRGSWPVRLLVLLLRHAQRAGIRRRRRAQQRRPDLDGQRLDHG